MKTNNTSDMVVIGKVGSPMGLKGEFRITLYAQDSNNLKEGKVLLLKHAGESGGGAGGSRDRSLGHLAQGPVPESHPESHVIQRVRYQKDRPVVKLEGFDDRTAVEALRNMEVYIAADDLEELPEGEHYVRNIIGCKVVDIAGGVEKEIGVLKDVIQNTAQSVLDVETAEGKRVLIPAVDAFLRSIDEEAGRIEVELIPGFLD